jgi:hypothetical protein
MESAQRGNRSTTGSSMPSASPAAAGSRNDAASTDMSVRTLESWTLLDDDVWVMMMASYWRIMSAIDRKVKEETGGLPDFLAADAEREIRATAYAEEQRIWSAGMDRLCQLYNVPEGPVRASDANLEQGALL